MRSLKFTYYKDYVKYKKYVNNVHNDFCLLLYSSITKQIDINNILHLATMYSLSASYLKKKNYFLSISTNSFSMILNFISYLKSQNAHHFIHGLLFKNLSIFSSHFLLSIENFLINKKYLSSLEKLNIILPIKKIIIKYLFCIVDFKFNLIKTINS